MCKRAEFHASNITTDCPLRNLQPMSLEDLYTCIYIYLIGLHRILSRKFEQCVSCEGFMRV